MFYNDNDPNCVAWLDNLQSSGLLPVGVVSPDPVEDLKPSDLVGHTQCHFFAGIGGWPLALQTAGIPESVNAWTFSCPCQPFSIAGAKRGEDDERHVWPAMRDLIEEFRPSVCFGEQVASPLGREWLSGVLSDLEALGYITCAADLCAAGIGAPHVRQRLYFSAFLAGRTIKLGPSARSSKLGHTNSQRRPEGVQPEVLGDISGRGKAGRPWDRSGSPGSVGQLGHADGQGLEGQLPDEPAGQGIPGAAGVQGGMGRRGDSQELSPGELADSKCRSRDERSSVEQSPSSGESYEPSPDQLGGCSDAGSSYWDGAGVVVCSDKTRWGDFKARRFEPGTFPLAYGLPEGVESTRSVTRVRSTLLRGYGNAIVVPLAAKFVEASFDAAKDTFRSR